jgi:hypothetical protein
MNHFKSVCFLIDPSKMLPKSGKFIWYHNFQLLPCFPAVAQMANLMAEWLILAGAEIGEVQQRVENHLHDMILKTFDPKKADAIFAEEGETPSWFVFFSSLT